MFNSLNAATNDFIRGFFSCSSETAENFAMIRATGANYIHTYSGGAEAGAGWDKVQSTLDLAKQYKLKVILNCNFKAMENRTDYLTVYRNYIQHFKSHPALGGWYIADEPEENELNKITAIYDLVKSEDSNHPVFLCNNWITGWYNFNICTDILMLNGYPVRDETFPFAPLTDFSKFIFAGSHLTNAKPIIGVPQIMNWKCYPEQIAPAGMRYPNQTELRYFFWSTIAQKAQGIFGYSFADIVNKDNNPAYFNNTIKPLMLKIKEFNLLTSGATITQLVPNSPNTLPPFFVTLFTTANKQYLIFINNSQNEFNNVSEAITLPYGNYKFRPILATANSATTFVSGQLMIDHVDPWESFIWELDKNLLQNPGFENDGAGWSFTDNNVQITTAPIASGNQALKITHNGQYRRCRQTVKGLIGNKTYYIAASMKGECSGDNYISLTWLNNTNTTIGVTYLSGNSYDNDYVRKMKSAVSPSGTVKAIIRLTANGVSSGQAYFDDIYFGDKPMPRSNKNLIRNSGFENGRTEWSFTDNNVQITTSPITNGNKALKIVHNGQYRRCRQTVKGLIGNNSYHIAAWMNGDNIINSKCFISLTWLDATGTPVGTPQYLIGNANDISYLIAGKTITSPSGTTQVIIRLTGGQGSSGQAYFDEIYFGNK